MALRFRQPAPVVDIRRRQHETDRLPGWLRGLYTACFLVILAVSLLDLARTVYVTAVPSFVAPTLDVEDGNVVVSDAADAPELREGDVVTALGDQPFDGTPARDLERRLKAFGRQPSLELTLARPSGDSSETVTATLNLQPYEWDNVVRTVPTTLWTLLVAVLGLMVVRAREGRFAVSRYLQFSILAVMPILVIGQFGAYLSLVSPWLGLMPTLAITPFELAAAFSLWFAAPFLIGWAVLRFLHVFPEPDSDLAERYPMPRFSRLWRWIFWGLLAACAAFFTTWILRPNDVLVSLFTAVFAVTLIAGLLLAVLWLCRAAVSVFRLARVRLLNAPPDSVRSAGTVLLGVRWGALLFGLSAILTVAMIPLRMLNDDVTSELAILSVIRTAAVTVPFLGIALAISRGGLWDVDRLVRRATLLTVLGALFVCAWLGFEALLEIIVPQGVFGLGPALAGAAVAAIGRPVSQAFTRRFFPDVADFPAALERASSRLSAESAEPESMHMRLGRALGEGLALGRYAVVTRQHSGRGRHVHCKPEDMDVTLVLDAASPILANSAAAIVETDDGPLLLIALGQSRDTGPVVMLGLRAGKHFYGRDEIQLLRLLLNPLAPLLIREPAFHSTSGSG